MIKFAFTDGEKVCLYNDGEITVQNNLFMENYRKNAESVKRTKKWKHSGEGAAFRGELDMDDGTEIEGNLSGVAITDGGMTCAYSFTISETSGIYYKNMELEKDNEAHLINSVDYNFSNLFCDVKNKQIACSVQRNSCNADIALFDMEKGDYKTLTDGDTMDEYPFISPEDSDKIYFSSRPVGRNAGGEFCGYAPSVVCLLDLDKMDISTLIEDKKYSFVRPVFYGGEVYAIKTPVKERRGNPLLEIILIPYRLLQAIVSFIHLFIVAFTGKSVVSGGSGGNNPTKKRDKDQKKIYIDGNLVNVDKEMKQNAKKKDKDFVFIPSSWKLINGNGEELASGVADYDIDGDGNIFYTNGKHIFMLNEGKKKKLCDCDYCVNISCTHESRTPSSIFDF